MHLYLLEDYGHIHIKNDVSMDSLCERHDPLMHQVLLLFQTTLTRPVGVIDFQHGVIKKFHADKKTWQDTATFSVPSDLLQKKLEWTNRVCAEGDRKVYILDTRDMVLHCLDVARKEWNNRQVDTPYRAKWAAMTYVNGILYVSGGLDLNTRVKYRTMLSMAVAGGDQFPLSVKRQRDMLYRRSEHGMAGVGRMVLVCGGGGDSTYLANSEGFDLETGAWSRLADMPIAKSAMSLVSTGTAVFVLGGVTEYTAGSATLSDTVSMFDSQTRQWTPLPKLPMSLGIIQGVYRGQSLWLLAATTGVRRNENNPGTGFSDPLTYVLEYDVPQQRWVKHFETPHVGTAGNKAYTFPL